MLRQLKNVFVVAAAGLTLAACNSMGAKTDGAMIVNESCPLMADHGIDPDVTVDYEGHKVAFCCSKCIGKWEEWSDDKKMAYVKNSMAAKK